MGRLKNQDRCIHSTCQQSVFTYASDIYNFQAQSRASENNSKKKGTEKMTTLEQNDQLDFGPTPNNVTF
jgi:hypothetical protein